MTGAVSKDPKVANPPETMLELSPMHHYQSHKWGNDSSKFMRNRRERERAYKIQEHKMGAMNVCAVDRSRQNLENLFILPLLVNCSSVSIFNAAGALCGPSRSIDIRRQENI